MKQGFYLFHFDFGKQRLKDLQMENDTFKRNSLEFYLKFKKKTSGELLCHVSI